MVQGSAWHLWSYQGLLDLDLEPTQCCRCASIHSRRQRAVPCMYEYPLDDVMGNAISRVLNSAFSISGGICCKSTAAAAHTLHILVSVLPCEIRTLPYPLPCSKPPPGQGVNAAHSSLLQLGGGPALCVTWRLRCQQPVPWARQQRHTCWGRAQGGTLQPCLLPEGPPRAWWHRG